MNRDYDELDDYVVLDGDDEEEFDDDELVRDLLENMPCDNTGVCSGHYCRNYHNCFK